MTDTAARCVAAGAGLGTVCVVPSMTTTGVAASTVEVRSLTTTTGGETPGVVGWIDGTEMTTPEIVVCSPGLSVLSPGRITAPGFAVVVGLVTSPVAVGTGTGTMGKGSSGSLLGSAGPAGGGKLLAGGGADGFVVSGWSGLPGTVETTGS